MRSHTNPALAAGAVCLAPHPPAARRCRRGRRFGRGAPLREGPRERVRFYAWYRMGFYRKAVDMLKCLKLEINLLTCVNKLFQLLETVG